MTAPTLGSDIVTKLTRIIPRKDGSEVRIVVDSTACPSTLNRHSFTYVHKRQTPEHNWELCSDSPHPDWKKMSRADYVSFGRSEKLQSVSHGEILGLSQWIGKPMAEFEQAHA